MSSQDSASNAAKATDPDSQGNGSSDSAHPSQSATSTQLSAQSGDQTQSTRLATETPTTQPSSSSSLAHPEVHTSSNSSSGGPNASAVTSITIQPDQLPSSPLSPTTSLQLRISALEYLVRGANTAIPTLESVPIHQPAPTASTASNVTEFSATSHRDSSSYSKESKIMDRLSAIQQEVNRLTASNKPLRKFFKEIFDELPPLTDHTNVISSTTTNAAASTLSLVSWTDEQKLHRLLLQLQDQPSSRDSGSTEGSLSANITTQQLELKNTLDNLTHIRHLFEQRRVLEAGNLKTLLTNRGDSGHHQARLQTLLQKQRELDSEWNAIQQDLLTVVGENHHQVNTTSRLFLALDEEVLGLEQQLRHTARSVT